MAAHSSVTLAPFTSGKQDRQWTLAVTAVSVLMATLDAGIVNISLPTLVSSFHTSFAAVQWVVVAYVLVLTALLMTAARLGDMFPKKHIFTVGIAVFTAGSLLCGLATSVEMLVGFRVIQGVGAAMTQAMGPALVTEVFPAGERGRALGIIGGTVSIGLAMGPGLGGLIIGLAGWRVIFLINVPVGILGLLAAFRKLPKPAPPRLGQQFDLGGATLLLIALAAYAAAMTRGTKAGFFTAQSLTLLGFALVGLTAFLVQERRAADPMLDLALFRNGFFSLNLLMGFSTFITLSAGFVLPFFLEIAKGLSPAQVGLLMTAQPIAMGLVAPLAGSLSDRLGSRGITTVGLLVGTVGCASVASLNVDDSIVSFVLATALTGVGIGLFQSPNNSAIMGEAPRDRLGAASGLLALSRTLGHTTGMPLMGAIFISAAVYGNAGSTLTGVTELSPSAAALGNRTAYLAAAVIMFLNTLVAAGVRHRYRRRRATFARAEQL